MKMTIKERMTFGELLPDKGNIVTLTIAQDIKKKTEITQEDIKTYDIVSDEKGVKWNADVVQEKEVKFSGLELDFLKEQVAALDKKSEIPSRLFDVCVKIKAEDNDNKSEQYIP